MPEKASDDAWLLQDSSVPSTWTGCLGSSPSTCWRRHRDTPGASGSDLCVSSYPRSSKPCFSKARFSREFLHPLRCAPRTHSCSKTAWFPKALSLLGEGLQRCLCRSCSELLKQKNRVWKTGFGPFWHTHCTDCLQNRWSHVQWTVATPMARCPAASLRDCWLLRLAAWFAASCSRELLQRMQTRKALTFLHPLRGEGKSSPRIYSRAALWTPLHTLTASWEIQCQSLLA